MLYTLFQKCTAEEQRTLFPLESAPEHHLAHDLAADERSVALGVFETADVQEAGGTFRLFLRQVPRVDAAQLDERCVGEDDRVHAIEVSPVPLEKLDRVVSLVVDDDDGVTGLLDESFVTIEVVCLVDSCRKRRFFGNRNELAVHTAWHHHLCWRRLRTVDRSNLLGATAAEDHTERDERRAGHG